MFVIKGVQKKERDNLLVWEERAPQLVIELTCNDSRREDRKKVWLYRDVLKVREYFLLDTKGDYLIPRLQGFRLSDGIYAPVAEVEGRLPSLELGLHLEQSNRSLRLWNPVTGAWLMTYEEQIEQSRQSIAESRRSIAESKKGIAEARRRAEQAKRELEKVGCAIKARRAGQ